MAAPAAAIDAPFEPCACVVLHGLSTAALNGALGVVEPPSAGATPGRMPVRVVSQRDVAESRHAPLAVKPANLRRCTAGELASLHARELVQHLQDELYAASVALQAAGDDVAKANAALTRLRACVAHAEAALAYVEGPGNALPADVSGVAREGLAATYAFVVSTACANVAATCAARGDAAGQLAAYARAFAKALQHPRVAAAAAELGQGGSVQEMCLRYGEARRCAGRPRDALLPLRLAVRVAAAENDVATEAAAQGTLSSVLLSQSDYAPADAAGESELALLLAMRPRTAPLALARARASLGNVKHARATAAGAGSPAAAAFAACAEALAEAAIGAIPRECSGSEAVQWAEMACGAHALRGHLQLLHDDLEAAAMHYEAALDVATRGLGAAAGLRGSRRPPLPTDAAVTPHFQLERVHGQLANRARGRGAAEAAREHGLKAVHHRRELFGLVGKPMPAECCICADALAAEEPDSDVALLPCLHVFHTRCIDEWLIGKMQGTCPLCREWSIAVERDDVEAYRETMHALGHAALDG